MYLLGHKSPIRLSHPSHGISTALLIRAALGDHAKTRPPCRMDSRYFGFASYYILPFSLFSCYSSFTTIVCNQALGEGGGGARMRGVMRDASPVE